MKAALAVALFAASTVVADAQIPAKSESEMRHLHVPYVRSATKCIATTTLMDQQFSLAVSADNFQPLIARAIEVCKQPLTLMIEMHDATAVAGRRFSPGPI